MSEKSFACLVVSVVVGFFAEMAFLFFQLTTAGVSEEGGIIIFLFQHLGYLLLPVGMMATAIAVFASRKLNWQWSIVWTGFYVLLFGLFICLKGLAGTLLPFLIHLRHAPVPELITETEPVIFGLLVLGMISFFLFHALLAIREKFPLLKVILP